MTGELLIRNVSVDGRDCVDVAIAGGIIAAMGTNLPARGRVLDGRGAALLPGLHDHHIHLFGLAAQMNSVRLDGASSAVEVRARLRQRADVHPPGNWVRATGYHESMAGSLDRGVLDRWLGDVPLRVQYRTGTLWAFNSAGLACLIGNKKDEALEHDAAGRATGRLWHGDAWLKARLGSQPPPFRPVGRTLAAAGITGVTDASSTTGAAEARLLAAARREGDLPQRLWLMSGSALDRDPENLYAVGPVKIMLHEAHLPAFDDVVARVDQARLWQRRVAFHCATATELALALAVLDAAGVQPGDRIEHGSLIDDAAADALAERGLTVVTQPAFIPERGDSYLSAVDPAEHGNLYRCATLLSRGIPVAGSSDAPYTQPDPWAAIAAATQRRTATGHSLGAAEAVSPLQALRLYLGEPSDPGGAPRQIVVGAAADLCLLNVPLDRMLADPHQRWVAATIVAGEPVYMHDKAALECATV